MVFYKATWYVQRTYTWQEAEFVYDLYQVMSLVWTLISLTLM